MNTAAAITHIEIESIEGGNSAAKGGRGARAEHPLKKRLWRVSKKSISFAKTLLRLL
jgi:hypothetical protein